MRYAQQEEARGERGVKRKEKNGSARTTEEGEGKKRAPRHSPRGSNLSRNPDRGGRAHEVGRKKAEWINIYSELMGLESRSPSRGGTRGGSYDGYCIVCTSSGGISRTPTCKIILREERMIGDRGGIVLVGNEECGSSKKGREKKRGESER